MFCKLIFFFGFNLDLAGLMKVIIDIFEELKIIDKADNK